MIFDCAVPFYSNHCHEFCHTLFGKRARNVIITKCHQASANIISIFVILMYLCRYLFPIKIVYHKNVILTLGSLEISK